MRTDISSDIHRPVPSHSPPSPSLQSPPSSADDNDVLIRLNDFCAWAADTVSTIANAGGRVTPNFAPITKRFKLDLNALHFWLYLRRLQLATLIFIEAEAIKQRVTYATVDEYAGRLPVGDTTKWFLAKRPFTFDMRNYFKDRFHVVTGHAFPKAPDFVGAAAFVAAFIQADDIDKTKQETMWFYLAGVPFSRLMATILSFLYSLRDDNSNQFMPLSLDLLTSIRKEDEFKEFLAALELVTKTKIKTVTWAAVMHLASTMAPTSLYRQFLLALGALTHTSAAVRNYLGVGDEDSDVTVLQVQEQQQQVNPSDAVHVSELQTNCRRSTRKRQAARIAERNDASSEVAEQGQKKAMKQTLYTVTAITAMRCVHRQFPKEPVFEYLVHWKPSDDREWEPDWLPRDDKRLLVNSYESIIELHERLHLADVERRGKLFTDDGLSVRDLLASAG